MDRAEFPSVSPIKILPEYGTFRTTKKPMSIHDYEPKSLFSTAFKKRFSITSWRCNLMQLTAPFPSVRFDGL